MSEGPLHVQVSVTSLIERDMAEQSRALLRVQHARMFPGGCPQRCLDCRVRLASVERLSVTDGDGVGGWEGVGVALGAISSALVIGLVWLALSGRFAW